MTKIINSAHQQLSHSNVLGNFAPKKNPQISSTQVLTGRDKRHNTDDRVANAEDCPKHRDCLRVSDIVGRVHVTRVDILYLRSHG